MLIDSPTIEQSPNVFPIVMEDFISTTKEIECPTCGFNSKLVNNKEYECLHGHRFKG